MGQFEKAMMIALSFRILWRELSSVNPAIPMDPSEFSRNTIRGRLSDARERMTDMTEMIHSISFFVVGINRWRRKCVFRHVN